MRALIALTAAIALLAACASPPPANPVAGSSGSRMILAGTLSLGECEMSIAPLYTRAAIAAHRASRRQDDGRLTLAQAGVIQTKGLALLAELDAVCPLERDGRIDDAEHNRRHVREVALPALEAMIPGAKK